jgi:error-prone DNA polymerase
VEATSGKKLTLANIPEGDEKVYDMICQADTMGGFQIESRAQMSMLPRLQPRNFYDLVIEVAIVRPGPIQGNMVHPYLRRRFGEEEITYPDVAIQKELKEVLGKTCGVPLFQEQCMQLAIVAAGFTPGEADQLRRAMGAWRRPGLIDQFHEKLLTGMQQKGLSVEFAARVFQQIRGFGEYGFPESHAASFALLVYVSCWLKHHHLAEFTAALINSQPMGFYAPAQLIQNARRHGVEVSPIDVCHSDYDCTIESRGLRLGLRLIRGLAEGACRKIIAERGARPFASLPDFIKRTALLPAQVQCLAEADSLRSLAPTRRDAVWNALAVKPKPRQKTLFDDLPLDEPPAALPSMMPEEEVHCDYQTTGMSLRAHPLSFHRNDLASLGVIPNEQLARVETESLVKVAGIVLMRQRPATAKDITFVTIEDETGTAYLIVHLKTWERFRRIVRHSQCWIVHGKVERRGLVIHLIVERIDDLSSRLAPLLLKSRDFR